MADSWFSYCKLKFVKNLNFLKIIVKFSKRDWVKIKKRGGGTSFLLSNGKIFDKVGVNKSTFQEFF